MWLCSALDLKTDVLVERRVCRFESAADGSCAGIHSGDVRFAGRHIFAGFSETGIQPIERIEAAAQSMRLVQGSVRLKLQDEMVRIVGGHGRQSMPMVKEVLPDAAGYSTVRVTVPAAVVAPDVPVTAMV